MLVAIRHTRNRGKRKVWDGTRHMVPKKLTRAIGSQYAKGIANSENGIITEIRISGGGNIAAPGGKNPVDAKINANTTAPGIE